mmetsp:Transcript_12666/g.25309  ORF Transcript_12666/g.25309 Transcript_12666/m.25309 type:complete len:580 (+) Transcript_12666:920-2659(+)
MCCCVLLPFVEMNYHDVCCFCDVYYCYAYCASHHHHHHHDAAAIATTTTTNDPMLLTTTVDDEMLPPALPPPPIPQAAAAQPAPQVLHHHNISTTTTTTTTAPLLMIRPSPEGLPDKPKSKRINWGKSPHKERLTTILNDWFSKSGQCIDEHSGLPIPDYRVYASKVGISRTTLFKYIHKDPSKRRLLRDDAGSGTRGKKRLMSEEDVRRIVQELKEGKDDSSPPSRNEAVDLIVKRFGLTRQAASRQLTRHVMPMFHNEGIYLVGGDNAEDDAGGKLPAAAQQQAAVGGVTTMTETGVDDDIITTIHQTKRSIVISGVTSGLGRALLGYFYNHGHTVAGCGRRVGEIQALQAQFPNAKLSAVDVSNDKSVQLWADTICGGVNDVENERKVDLVIANAGISPETMHQTKAAWEVPRQDFDDTIDVNIKGVSNMIRHFVPRMVKNNVGTFVAMSSGLGRSPNPHHVAYCASKWAVEGMVKSLAMSLPPDGPMCAVPLAPGVVQTGMQPGGSDGKNEGSLSSSSSGNIDKWIEVAGPMILGLSRKDNGKSLSVKGFYSVRYRQSWSFPDGSGIPDRVGHIF